MQSIKCSVGLTSVLVKVTLSSCMAVVTDTDGRSEGCIRSVFILKIFQFGFLWQTSKEEEEKCKKQSMTDLKWEYSCFIRMESGKTGTAMLRKEALCSLHFPVFTCSCEFSSVIINNACFSHLYSGNIYFQMIGHDWTGLTNLSYCMSIHSEKMLHI